MSELHRDIATAVGVEVVATSAVSGGDVAESFRVELADDRVVFAKTHAAPPANFFSTEARGLGWLRQARAVLVPQVVAVSDDPPLLVLEWIDESRAEPGDEASFGRSLATMHQAGATGFGRKDGRTTGSRGLPNQLCDHWADFYATQRLEPLCRLARDGDVLGSAELAMIESIAACLNKFGGADEPPARLHGDLWAGNRIIDSAGQSWLIDPACHGGHREFDLAMMRLFGGFGQHAFDAYDELFPLADGWQERVVLHQLGPLLVHAIKFGGSYVAAVQDAAARYAR